MATQACGVMQTNYIGPFGFAQGRLFAWCFPGCVGACWAQRDKSLGPNGDAGIGLQNQAGFFEGEARVAGEKLSPVSVA